MDSLGDIFRTFCKYVDERIFPEENAGTYVAFVVDQSFIDEFCKIYAVKESLLMDAVRESLYSYHRDSLFVKGMLAIQLYAASKRANDGFITEKNYRERLSQVLDWDINDLQYWMQEYQEDIWKSLYDWCDKHYFQITKCQKRTGTGRYVQYPVNQALRVFTDEDLKYIAACFVNKKLSPGEDIQKRDFRKLIGKYDILQSVVTNHGRLVIQNSISDEDYYNQIYNFFLRWDGKFKERTGGAKSIIKNDSEQLFLYLPNDFSCLEFRSSKLALEKRLNMELASYESLSSIYTFKRPGVILFKHDDVYENYWQEVRYLEGKDEEGLLVCYFNNESNYHYSLRPSLVWQNKHVQIFKIKYGYNTIDLYTEKRFYDLYGGLKIGRQLYLLGGAPILKLETPTRIWIDGKSFGDGKIVGSVSLNHLDEGHHYIKIQDYKRIDFDIIKSNPSKCSWMTFYHQWKIDKVNQRWESVKEDRGIIGLDYSVIPQEKNSSQLPILTRWSRLVTFGQKSDDETNIAIRIIKQTGI